jgi:hypothetical protein
VFDFELQHQGKRYCMQRFVSQQTVQEQSTGKANILAHNQSSTRMQQFMRLQNSQ